MRTVELCSAASCLGPRQHPPLLSHLLRLWLRLRLGGLLLRLRSLRRRDPLLSSLHHRSVTELKTISLLVLSLPDDRTVLIQNIVAHAVTLPFDSSPLS